MTDIVLFSAALIPSASKWAGFITRAQEDPVSVQRGRMFEFLCLDMWWTWMWACTSCFRKLHMTTVLICSGLSPLLGCKGQWRTTEGLIPSPHGPTSTASQTIVLRHRWSSEWSRGIEGLGWHEGVRGGGGGAEKEVVTSRRREPWRRVGWRSLSLSASLLLKADRQGPKPGSRGLCRFNDLFPRDPDFTLKLPLERWSP